MQNLVMHVRAEHDPLGIKFLQLITALMNIITVFINDNWALESLLQMLRKCPITLHEIIYLRSFSSLSNRRDSGTLEGRRISNTRGPREVTDSQILGDLRIVGKIRR